MSQKTLTIPVIKYLYFFAKKSIKRKTKPNTRYMTEGEWKDWEKIKLELNL